MSTSCGVDAEQVPAGGLERPLALRLVVRRMGSTAWIRNGSMIVCQRSMAASIRVAPNAARSLPGSRPEKDEAGAPDTGFNQSWVIRPARIVPR